MKTIYFCLLCISTLCLVNCGARESTEKATSLTHSDTISTKDVSVETVSKAWSKDDFIEFWEAFTTQADDKENILSLIDFPYSDGFKRITQADFRNTENDHFISFHDVANVTFGQLKADGYLNYKLSELFNEKYGSLDEIYVVRHEDDPAGYYAYFKYFNDKFKLIGFEETMDASH